MTEKRLKDMRSLARNGQFISQSFDHGDLFGNEDTEHAATDVASIGTCFAATMVPRMPRHKKVQYR